MFALWFDQRSVKQVQFNLKKEVRYIENSISKSYQIKNLNYEEMLTPQDVMGRLFIGKNKVYELLQTGELKSVRVGKQYRIPGSALKSYLKENEFSEC